MDYSVGQDRWEDAWSSRLLGALEDFEDEGEDEFTAPLQCGVSVPSEVRGITNPIERPEASGLASFSGSKKVLYTSVTVP